MTEQEPTPTPTRRTSASPQRNFWRRPKPTAEDMTDQRIRKMAELWATIILSVATLVTAWAGYEAGKWNSVQTALNLKSTALRIDAGQLVSEAQQQWQADLGNYTQWVNATGNGNTRLAEFYRARFRDGFRPAFDAWLATDPLNNPDAPASPFEMEEYRQLNESGVDEIYETAEQLILQGEVAGSFADQYTLLVVILAGSLLLAGLAHRFEWAELRAIVVGVALLILLYCVVVIIRLPAI